MKKRLVIFGTGDNGEIAHFYFSHDSPYEVIAFTVHARCIVEKTHFGLPVAPFEEIERFYPPEGHAMFIGVGYRDVNRFRAGLVGAARAKGYALASYVSSRSVTWPGSTPGENCFILERVTIGPNALLGSDVAVRCGSHIGQHARIGDHVYIAPHAVVGDRSDVAKYSFLGVNSTVGDGISIGESNVIGAGAVVLLSTGPREVYPASPTKPSTQTSDMVRL